MMNKQETRRQQQRMYGGQGLLTQIQKANNGKSLDFAKLVKNIDWNGMDVIKLQQKLHKDDEKAKQFHEQRSQYYKQLGPRKGVFQTVDANKRSDTTGENKAFGLQTIKVLPKKAKDKEKQREDVLHELTNVAQTLLPAMERRQQEVRRQALIRHREEEEKKFEDKDYLKAYFNEMREQIDSDIRNSKRYFPVPLMK